MPALDDHAPAETTGVTRREALKGVAALAGSALCLDATLGKAQDSTSAEVPDVPLANARDQSFDTGWCFHLGEREGAERPDFDDHSWQRLDLPHDWSIEDLPVRPEAGNDSAIWAPNNIPARIGPFDRDLSEGQTATGFVMGGTGWYRKRFSIAGLPAGQRYEIRFDGVHMDSDLWLNGRHLGNHPYGYTSFAFDLTPHLCRDRENVLAVRVRNEGKNSRWYSGSGIYRHVWLTMTGDIRIPLWGIYVITPEVSPASATVRVLTQIQNQRNTAQNTTVRVQLLAPDGHEAGVKVVERAIAASSTEGVEHRFIIASPLLWSHETPNIYRAEAEVLVMKEIVDRCSTTFGIRKVDVDVERGLRLNGEMVKLKGGCLHHDNGVLGSVAIDRAEERRVELLKANGFNAIRTSHNPPSPAFLDECDRLGMLVIDEAFDMWEKPNNPQDYHRFFDEWWQRDISSMVRRDRNHPSLIFWSIGNEIPERAEPRGVEIAGWLVSEVKRHDSSRPVTMAVCELEAPGSKWSDTDPAFLHLDIGGYNYNWKQYEPDHQRFPKRVMMGTESFPSEAFDVWQVIQKRPYVLGDFVWTAMDYLGEVGIGHSTLEQNPDAFLTGYPWFNSYCGDIDLIGEKKAQSYFRDVLWGRSKLEMAVQRPIPKNHSENISKWGWSDELRSWTWPGFEGNPLKVRVYSSGDHVRLLLNGTVIGTEPVSPATKLRAEFTVPYVPGELRVIALQKGKEIASLCFRTVGKPAKLKLTPDRTSIRRDRNDLAYITVEVLDSAGDLVPDAIVLVKFSLTGAGQLAAVGNANPKDVDSFQQPHRRTFHGKCLAVVRPIGTPGSMTLQAEATGLAPATVTVNVG